MVECTCSVNWYRHPLDRFAEGRFTRNHTWRFDGGVTVPASASPHIVPAPFSARNRVDPEEAFVAAVASCHMLTFLYLACREGYTVESYSDAPVGILASDDAGFRSMTCITLHPKVEFDEPVCEQCVAQLHAEAHEYCFIARSIKAEVRIELGFDAPAAVAAAHAHA